MFGAPIDPFRSKKRRALRLRREKIRAQEYPWTDSDLEITSKSSNNRYLINEKSTSNPVIYNPERNRNTRVDIKRCKKLAQLPIQQISEECLEISIEQIHRPDCILNIPTQPSWTYSMTSEQIQEQEQIYFNKYLEKIFSTVPCKSPNYVEMNFDRWKQLWRTIEICDIILMIIDIRFAVLHFCPALYDYVTRIQNKSLIIILNKIDLAPPPIVIAIKDYFIRKFPHIRIITYTSYLKDLPVPYESYYTNSILPLLGCISSIAGSRVDLSAWKEHIQTCMNSKLNGNNLEDEIINPLPFSNIHKPSDGITLGFVGYPNVGKTSILNSLIGRKVVHAAHSTIPTKQIKMTYLTSTIRLCDCPGLLFPSCVERPLQILAGTYPIRQVKEPYTSVIYLAQCVPLTKILQLDKLEGDISNYSALDICEAWAIKRGLFTRKKFCPDVYRAAKHILRLAIHGQINLCLRPPGFINEKEQRKSDVRTTELEDQIQSWITKTLQSDDSDDSQFFSTSDNYQFASSSESAQ